MPTLTRPHVRVLASAVLALVAGIGGVATAGAASAEAPVDLVEEVTDHAGVLSPQDAEAVAARLDALADSTPYQLFVVYVGSFDGMAPADWADETAVGSGLGRDDILLAVAVDDRQYQVSVAQEIALTDDQLGDVEADRIEPALRDDDWAGAAVAAADGYEAAAAGDASGEDPVGVVTGRSFGVSWPALGAGVGGLALLVAGVVVVPRQVRRRRAAAAAEADLDAMDGRASSALVAVDEAVATSTQELGFAEAELGATTTAPFAAALDAARTELAAAFGARQRLDDTQPESDDERRALLTLILDACARVDAALDAQTAEFVRLRDLHARVPQVLVEAAEQAVRLAARTDVTESSLNDLAARYAPSALAAVAGNVDDTRAVLDRARAATAQGTATLDTDRAAAVAAAQVAVDALAQAAALLDAVDATARDLAQAPDRLVQACA
ncbi:TPM domain-containing protein, partial [Cellulomonas biazotea]|uniref:TPM domain-containing protein n=1 Tax=Cellulomonas biazotea TaxID=1709 RepID=UPI0013EF3209